jgi:hypothetical protein
MNSSLSFVQKLSVIVAMMNSRSDLLAVQTDDYIIRSINVLIRNMK